MLRTYEVTATWTVQVEVPESMSDAEAIEIAEVEALANPSGVGNIDVYDITEEEDNEVEDRLDG